jgi:hypothetical protein
LGVFRENLKALIEASAGPDLAPIVGRMGTDKVMEKITPAYAFYKQNQERLDALGKKLSTNRQ